MSSRSAIINAENEGRALSRDPIWPRVNPANQCKHLCTTTLFVHDQGSPDPIKRWESGGDRTYIIVNYRAFFCPLPSNARLAANSSAAPANILSLFEINQPCPTVPTAAILVLIDNTSEPYSLVLCGSRAVRLQPTDKMWRACTLRATPGVTNEGRTTTRTRPVTFAQTEAVGRSSPTSSCSSFFVGTPANSPCKPAFIFASGDAAASDFPRWMTT